MGILDFISILLITSIQKRKIKSSHWFFEDLILENLIMKKIMTNNKFHDILSYSYAYNTRGQSNASRDNYDPAHKIQKFKDMLEIRYNKAFIPGCALSLDESLIRCFRCLKFKILIIAKSARYRIKVHIIAYATTACAGNILHWKVYLLY